MRNTLILCAVLTVASLCQGQVSVRTRTFSFGKPILGVRGEIQGETGAAYLKASAGGTLVLSITNSGAATAHGAVVTLAPEGRVKDLRIVRVDSLGEIKPGEVRIEKIEVSVPDDARSQKGTLAITVSADPGPVTADTRVDIDIRGVVPPVHDTLSVAVKLPPPGPKEAGFEAFRRGDYNTAIASLEKVVSSGKATKEVYFTLGLAYFRNRNRSRCLADMKKASGLGSAEARIWLRENTTPVEIVSVAYKQVDPDPFQGYSPPIGLGVLPFADSLAHDTPVTEKMYGALKSKNVKHRIFPYSTVRSEQATWGLTALAPSNKRILSALESELSINFAVTGTVLDTAGSVFTMRVIRCKDGAAVFTHLFRTTSASSAIEDAVTLLLKGKVPVYTVSHTQEVNLP
jgi:hypothetical protein